MIFKLIDYWRFKNRFLGFSIKGYDYGKLEMGFKNLYFEVFR